MREVQNRPELKGMGTTVVASLFENGRATFVHVGDSRAYLLRNGELRRLTDDHSWVQEQVNAGILSPDEAKSHPLKNVVTRALGGGTHVSPDLIEVSLARGDRFLLCSDGLTGMISDDELLEYLTSDSALDEKIPSKLIELANERGGVDNITAIVIEVPLDEELPAPAPAESADSRRRHTTDISLRAIRPEQIEAAQAANAEAAASAPVAEPPVSAAPAEAAPAEAPESTPEPPVPQTKPDVPS
jgi:protein phosphatase